MTALAPNATSCFYTYGGFDFLSDIVTYLSDQLDSVRCRDSFVDHVIERNALYDNRRIQRMCSPWDMVHSLFLQV